MVCCLMIAGVMGGFFLSKGNAQSDQVAVVSKEVLVTRGDIILSLSEEGTASIGTATTSLDLDVTVDEKQLDLDVVIGEILVRAGETVSKGQPLFTIDAVTLEKALDSLNNQYQLAELSLNQAQLNLTLGQSEATATLANQQNLATTADSTYESTIKQLTLEQEQLQKNITDLEEDSIYYQQLYNSFDERTANLATFKQLMISGEDNYEALQELYDDYTADNGDVVSSYQNAEKTTENLQEQLETAGANLSYLAQFEGTSEEYNAAITKAQTEYSSLANQFDAAVAIINGYQGTYDESLDLADRVKAASKASTQATETYNEYSSEYKELYGSLGKSEIARTLAQTNIDLESAQQSLADFMLTFDTKVLEASNTLNKNITTATVADTGYQSTINQLELAVLSAQLNVNDLGTYLNEMNSWLQGNKILAPCAGLITDIPFTTGDEVNLTEAYMTIAQPGQVSISLTIDQEDIAQVSLDQQALVTFDAFDETVFEGKVGGISVSPAQMGKPTVTYTVTVLVVDEGLSQVYEGMSCQVELVTERVNDVLIVSKRAITNEGGKSYVKMKNEDETTYLQEITTGFTDGSSYEVTSGLSEGDTILIESQGTTSEQPSGNQGSPKPPTDAGNGVMGDETLGNS